MLLVLAWLHFIGLITGLVFPHLQKVVTMLGCLQVYWDVYNM